MRLLIANNDREKSVSGKILLLFSFSSSQNPAIEKRQNIEKHTHKGERE
jgi:hypothetical protein